MCNLQFGLALANINFFLHLISLVRVWRLGTECQNSLYYIGEVSKSASAGLQGWEEFSQQLSTKPIPQPTMSVCNFGAEEVVVERTIC